MPPARRDVLLAAGLTLLVELELWATGPRAGSAVAALSFLALALCRRHPTAAVSVPAAALVLDAVAGGALAALHTPLAVIGIACFLAGLQAGSSWRAGAAGAIAIVALTAANQASPEQTYSLLDDMVFFALLLGTATLLGRLLRLRADLIAELAARANELRKAQAAEADAAVAEERARLAIGVHDALAHRVGEIALQAAGAQRLGDRDPSRALGALARIEATARAALDDIRDVIGVLRKGDDQIGLTPPRIPAGAVPAPWDPSETSEPPPRVSRRSVTVTDVCVAAAVFVALTVETLTSSRLEGPVAGNLVGLAAIAAPLAFRRRAPLAAAVATFAAASAQAALLTSPTVLVTAVVLLLLPAFSVAAYAPRRTAIVGLLACAAGTLATEPSVPAVLLMALAWIAGRGVRERGRRIDELRDLTRRLERSADAGAARARGEERLRVARELHDAVAHSMTVIVLQAEAAQRLWTEQPAAARAACAVVGEVARDTLGELRARLRAQDGASLDRLDGLVARMRALGLSVTVGHGSPALPAAIEHVAFSVLQEALTNAARHAAPTAVHVDIRREHDSVRIEVADCGRTSVAPKSVIPGSGTGLRGMAERVAACGGELRYGPAGRGFRVEARLPLDEAA